MLELFVILLLFSGSEGSEITEAPSVVPKTEAVQAVRTPEDQTPTGKFLTATEVKPILQATQGQWAAVRNWNGEDLVYFTNLLAWRCGLWDIHYAVNGGPFEVFDMEPCYPETAAPSALVDTDTYLPYISFPENSVETLDLRVLFDDGTEMLVSYDRASIQMP